MQHTAIFHGCKNDNFQLNFLEYQQSMFQSKNKKIMYTPVNPSFTLCKWGVRGSSLHGIVFVMVHHGNTPM